MRDDARSGPGGGGGGAGELPPEHVKTVHMHTFENGARRSELKPRYDLIPQTPLKRIAKRFEIGLKYGEFNYMKGLPFDDTFNHLIDHLESYKERRKEYFRLQQNLSSSAVELLDEARKKLQYRQFNVNGGAAVPMGYAAAGTLPTSVHLSLKEWMEKTEPDGDDLAGAAWGCIALMKMEELDVLK